MIGLCANGLIQVLGFHSLTPECLKIPNPEPETPKSYTKTVELRRHSHVCESRRDFTAEGLGLQARVRQKSGAS